MADQREITLRSGASPSEDIVLYSLPVATVSSGTDIFLYQGDATANDPILRDPTVAAGGGGTTVVAVDFSSAGSAGGSLVLAGVWLAELSSAGVGAVSGAASVISTAVVNVSGSSVVSVSAASVYPSVLSAAGVASLSGDSASIAGAVFSDSGVGAFDGQAASLYQSDFSASGLSSFLGELDSSLALSGGQGPIGGDFWLKRLEDEEAAPKKAVQIIKRVAEKQAEKREFSVAPLRVAFQRANYKFSPDYEQIYRRSYQAALDRIQRELEDDDEETIALLM